MSESEINRPVTVADCLENLAFHLADTDKIIAAYCKLVGKENPITGTDAQVDLSKWASWLRSHPEIDGEMMKEVK
jgi:hypothetical protein